MNMSKVLSPLCAAAVAMSNFAGHVALAESASVSARPSVEISQASPVIFQSYELGHDVSVKVVSVNNDDEKYFVNEKVTLPAGTDITILGAESDPRFGEILRLGVDEDLNSDTPTDFWIRAADLNSAQLLASQMGTGDNSSLFALEGDLLGIGDVTAAKHVIKRGRVVRGKGGRIGRRGKGGMTYCYRYVKQYLLSHKLVPIYLPGGSAWQSASLLPQYGYQVTSGPEGASRGTICVYRGGKGGNGHIEILLDQGWWYGYGYSATPMSQLAPANHQLIACFSK